MTSGKDEMGTRFKYLPGVASALVVVFVVISTFLLFDRLYPYGLGPKQPIPFSHKVHVHVKRLSCVMCHSQVASTARAGIPPLQTCLLCHERIITNYPYIRLLRRRFEQGKPVIWERVNWLPEFVYFNHSMHIHYGIDCGHCHGNVTMMDRVMKARNFKMGFCIECHRDNNASHDCFACHR
ncbi:cytochrome c family protein [Geomonas sp. RF6]|uniref:cytochrome c3 family protein n=1 Tax=Geomonas sp. RF6 TaxID=2897342 RepID=UPI001E4C28B5|nr:cytochrome c3 family protein [Geomonas sp. RF6]UFS70372.1 cytochrome c family protein [Geomonas sp. RF6]